MIDPKELRLGNYIYDDFNEVHRVECIKSQAFIEHDKADTETVIFSKLSNGGMYVCNEVNPIPLTEEWLEKFGFTPDDKVNWILRRGFLSVNAGDRWVWMYSGKVIGDVKYVHQLQNLIHILTGKELKP